MFSKIKLILASIVAVVGLIAAAFLRGRSSGKQEVQKEVKEVQTKAVEEVAHQRVENVKVVNKVQQEVIKSSDPAVDKELTNEWTR